MKISVLTFGSRGDVQPYAALAKGFRDAGHEVCLACDGYFETFVEEQGLAFCQAGDYVREMHDVIREHLKMSAMLQPLSFTRWVGSHLPAILEGSLAACDGADVILTSPAAIGSLHIAEKLGIPCIYSVVGPPLTPSIDSPSGYVPGFRYLPKFLNRGTYTLTEQALWQPFRKAINRWRSETLGLPPLAFAGPFARMRASKTPVLYGFSPLVIPRDPIWHENIHITGNWFLQTDPAWSPPPELADFLAAGPPPVYIGFGSMVSDDAARHGEMAVSALLKTGQRGVLARGWGGLDPASLPETIHAIDAAPHDWLFPKMAALIHHGGAGTTGVGLHAGVPATVVPFWTEQFYWGSRLRHLGIGPAPIPHRAMTADKLAAAIDTMLNDSEMRRKASMLGQRMRSEDGARRAVEIVEQLVDQADPVADRPHHL